jgi:Na+-transporting NADH:ubiquinone oxidoreductase subunit C
LALDKDTTTIRGITFYEHGETPGLGAEIENPKWKALWIGRKAFGEGWQPAIKIMKGQGGSPDLDPHRIDALSGATLTSRGVQNLVNFWMGDSGFGLYIRKFREQRS